LGQGRSKNRATRATLLVVETRCDSFRPDRDRLRTPPTARARYPPTKPRP